MLREDIDYALLEPLEEHLPSPVRILQGRYKDVIFMYGRVRIIENAPPSPPTLDFKYKILETGSHKKKFLEKSEHFKDFMGSMLQDMILEANEPHDETGTSDIEELDSEQRLYEESDPVSEKGLFRRPRGSRTL